MSEIRDDGVTFSDDSNEIVYMIAVVVFIGCVVGGLVYFLFLIVEFLKVATTTDNESKCIMFVADFLL